MTTYTIQINETQRKLLALALRHVTTTALMQFRAMTVPANAADTWGMGWFEDGENEIGILADLFEHLETADNPSDMVHGFCL